MLQNKQARGGSVGKGDTGKESGYCFSQVIFRIDQSRSSAAVALLLAQRPLIESSAGLSLGGKEKIYFSGRTQKSGQEKGWVRLILLPGPAVGGCGMEGYP